MRRTLILSTILALPAFVGAQVRLEVIPNTEQPIIDAAHPDAAGNKFGFEGGNGVKIDGVYHLVIAEMFGQPLWYPMRLAHWQSADGLHFKRVSTLFESTGGKPWDQQRASLAGPMFIWNDAENQWELHYVSYRGNHPNERGNQMDGTIFRAVSRTKGKAGIAGPYEDVAVTLRPDSETQPWEGQQATDSIFPYKAGDRWLAFYGGHNYEPIGPWSVGLAEAKTLAGPWKRLKEGNPVPIENIFIENPVVTIDDDGTFIAVYDSDDTAVAPATYNADPRTIGFTWSKDGVTWSKGEHIEILSPAAGPAPSASRDVRTPLGLIPEGGGRFTCYYTVRMGEPTYWEVRRVQVRRVVVRSAQTAPSAAH